MNIETQIRNFISKNLLLSNNGFRYTNDASFLEEGIVDSVGIMELVTFVEESFDIHVSDSEIIPENFDSVNQLSHFISHKIKS